MALKLFELGMAAVVVVISIGDGAANYRAAGKLPMGGGGGEGKAGKSEVSRAWRGACPCWQLCGALRGGLSLREKPWGCWDGWEKPWPSCCRR